MADSQHNVGIRIGGDATSITEAAKKAGMSIRELIAAFEQQRDQTKKNADETKRFVDGLKAQTDEVAKTGAALERHNAQQARWAETQRSVADASLAEVGALDKKQQAIQFVTRLTATAVTAVTAYAGATAIAVKGIIDNADNLNKLSQSLGVSTKALSVYQYQAALAGVSNTDFGQSIKALAKNIGEAQSGAGDGAGLFRLMGSEIEGLAKRGASIEELLPKIADRFAQFADGPNKAALAMAFFGRSGERMIPVLNGGAEGFRLAAQEAAEFNRIVGGNMAQQAENFNDSLKRMNALLTAGMHAIAQDSLPWLNRLIERLLAGAQAAGGFLNALSLPGLVTGNSRSVADIDREIAAREATYQGRSRAPSPGARFGFSEAGNVDTLAEIEKLKDERKFALFVQRQRALQVSGDMDTSDQNSRMAGRLSRGTQAPPPPKRGGAGAGESDYDRLTRSLATLIDTQDAAASSSEKLTQAETLHLQILNAVGAGTVKLTDAQYVELNVLIDRAKWGEIAAREREQMRKADEAFYKAEAASLIEQEKGLEKLKDANAKILEHNENIGASTAELGALKIARAEETLSLERQREALIAAHPHEVAALEIARARVKEAEEFVRRTQSGATRDVEVERAKRAEKEWKSTSESIERSLTDALMRGFDKGKSFMENLRDAAVNMFKTLVLEPIIRPVAQAGASMVLGALGMPGAANASGGGGMGFNPLSFLNMGGSGGGGGFMSALGMGAPVIEGLGGAFGTAAALGELGGIAGAASGVGGASGMLAGLGPWGMVAGAALALFGGDLFGDDGGGALPEIPLGFQHPGVDQARFANDPMYRKAAEQAEQQHVAWAGVTWTQPNANGDGSPAEAVARSIDLLYQAAATSARAVLAAESERAKVLLDQARASVQTAEAVRRFKADAESLLLSDVSPLTATERLDFARSQYSGALDAARDPGNDAEDLAALTGGRSTYLREAAGYYGTSTPTYRAIFDAAQADAGGIAGSMAVSLQASVAGLAEAVGSVFSDVMNEHTRQMRDAMVEQGRAIQASVQSALEATTRA